MTIRSREYRGETDYQRIRELLIESYDLNQKLHNWWLERLDSFRYGAHWREELTGERKWEADFRLWETAAGKLIGVVHSEGKGDVFFQVHPRYRHIEGEMLGWAEEHHRATKPQDANDWLLNFSVYEYDQERAALLKRRGYKNLGPAGVDRVCSLDKPIPNFELAAGYTIRRLRDDDDDDLEQLAAVTNLVFNASFTAGTFRVMRNAPTHREDFVVVAPDGTFAAFCAIWFDATNRFGAFEPVATHPEHRRRGLAKSVMCHGLRQLKELGAGAVHVGTGYKMAANRLYEAVGFTEVYVEDKWQKAF